MNPSTSHPQPARRALIALAGAALLALPVVGCGTTGVATSAGLPPAAATPTTTVVLRSSAKPKPSAAQDRSLLARFSGCVRAQGITDFPNPSSHGDPFSVTARRLGISPARLQAAERTCKEHLAGRAGAATPPAGSARAKRLKDAKQAGRSGGITAARFARCMRARGIRNFPVTGTISSSPKVLAAARVCKQSLAP